MRENPRALDEPLFKSDRVIAAELGLAYDVWLKKVKLLEKAGLPRRDPDVGHKRYWPAVKAWLDRRAGLEPASPPDAVKRVWEEKFR